MKMLLKKQSKYLGIVESLRAEIASGKYRSGARLPSEAELVRRFAVSRMTASKAIAHLQQEGLVTRRAGSGTYTTSAPEGQGLVFGLLIPDLGTTEIFEPICRGMARSSQAHRHSLSWGQSHSSQSEGLEEAEQLCHSYIQQKVAGVFFAPKEFGATHQEVNERILRALDTANIPVVLLDRGVGTNSHQREHDLISLNNRRAGYVVTEHLIRQGAKHIAFFARIGSATTVEDRIAGYREALFDNNMPSARSMILRGDATSKTFVEAAFLSQKITAVMCANDHTAANLMQTLLGLGIAIPEDVCIAGVDDVRYANLLPVPLTTYQQPCGELGAVAMSAMLERLRNPKLAARTILLDGSLVVRHSCKARQSQTRTIVV